MKTSHACASKEDQRSNASINRKIGTTKITVHCDFHRMTQTNAAQAALDNCWNIAKTAEQQKKPEITEPKFLRHTTAGPTTHRHYLRNLLAEEL